MPEPSAEWLDHFSGVVEIDPGEAQLYALAAEHGLLVFTGDKRALKALRSLIAVHPKFDGRIVTIEAALLGLVGCIAEPLLRARGKILGSYDQMAKAVFNSENSPLEPALESYLQHMESEIQPLKLWRPKPLVC